MIGKKSSVLLFVLGFAGVAYADVPCCCKPKFEFSITPIALKPSASNLNYVIYNLAAAPPQTPIWAEQELRPAYSFAFALAGRYIFPTNEDISLDWTHLDSTTTSSVAAPSAAYFLGPDYEIGPPATDIRNASGKAKFDYNVINLTVGQTLDFTRHFGLRFFGGLSTGFLNEEVDATYTGNVPNTGTYPGPFSTAQSVTSNFTGVGPRFGLDANYNSDYGFGVHGEAAVSALIGSIAAKTSYVSSSQELSTVFHQSSNYQTISDQNFVQVVPGFDTKLGLTYTHMFCRNVLLTLEAGYEAAVYINAINQYLPGSLVAATPPPLVEDISTGGIFVATMSHTQSNYSVQGPYLQATVKF